MKTTMWQFISGSPLTVNHPLFSFIVTECINAMFLLVRKFQMIAMLLNVVHGWGPKKLKKHITKESGRDSWPFYFIIISCDLTDLGKLCLLSADFVLSYFNDNLTRQLNQTLLVIRQIIFLLKYFNANQAH